MPSSRRSYQGAMTMWQKFCSPTRPTQLYSTSTPSSCPSPPRNLPPPPTPLLLPRTPSALLAVQALFFGTSRMTIFSALRRSFCTSLRPTIAVASASGWPSGGGRPLNRRRHHHHHRSRWRYLGRGPRGVKTSKFTKSPCARKKKRSFPLCPCPLRTAAPVYMHPWRLGEGGGSASLKWAFRSQEGKMRLPGGGFKVDLKIQNFLHQRYE